MEGPDLELQEPDHRGTGLSVVAGHNHYFCVGIGEEKENNRSATMQRLRIARGYPAAAKTLLAHFPR